MQLHGDYSLYQTRILIAKIDFGKALIAPVVKIVQPQNKITFTKTRRSEVAKNA